jgi:hypothetical protein
LKIVEISFGEPEIMKNKVITGTSLSPLSPLAYAEDAAHAIMAFAERGQMVIVAVALMAGINAPAGIGGRSLMINTIFIPLGTGMLLVSIGLSMQFKRVTDYMKECLAVAGIKFLIVPLAIGGMAYLIGYGEIENGLPLKVVIVLTSMPVAFSALIPPSIYDLDIDLANACWFFTTACLIWVLPVLLIVIEIISS